MRKTVRDVQRSLQALLSKHGPPATNSEGEVIAFHRAVQENADDVVYAGQRFGAQAPVLRPCASVFLDVAGWLYVASQSGRLAATTATVTLAMCYTCLNLASVLLGMLRGLDFHAAIAGKHRSAPDRQEWLLSAARQVLQRWLEVVDTGLLAGTPLAAAAAAAVTAAAAEGAIRDAVVNLTAAKLEAMDVTKRPNSAAAATAAMCSTWESKDCFQQAKAILHMCDWVVLSIHRVTNVGTDEGTQAIATWCQPAFLRLSALLVHTSSGFRKEDPDLAGVVGAMSLAVIAHSYEQKDLEAGWLYSAISQGLQHQQQQQEQDKQEPGGTDQQQQQQDQEQQQQGAGRPWQQPPLDALQLDMAVALKDVEVVWWYGLQSACIGMWPKVIARHQKHPYPLSKAALALYGTAGGSNMFGYQVSDDGLDNHNRAAARWIQLLLGHATHVGLWGQLGLVHEALGTHPADITSTIPPDAGSSSSTSNSSSRKGGSSSSSSRKGSSGSSSKGGSKGKGSRKGSSRSHSRAGASSSSSKALVEDGPDVGLYPQQLLKSGRLLWPLLACPAADGSQPGPEAGEAGQSGDGSQDAATMGGSRAAGATSPAAAGATGCETLQRPSHAAAPAAAATLAGAAEPHSSSNPGSGQPTAGGGTSSVAAASVSGETGAESLQQQQLQLALQYLIVCYELEAWNNLHEALLLLFLQLRGAPQPVRVQFLSGRFGDLLLMYLAQTAETSVTAAVHDAQEAAVHGGSYLMVQQGCAELQQAMLSHPRRALSVSIAGLTGALLAWAFLEPTPCRQWQPQQPHQQHVESQEGQGAQQQQQQRRQWVSCLGRDALAGGGVLRCNDSHGRGAAVLAALPISQLQLLPGYTPDMNFLMTILTVLQASELAVWPLGLLEVALGPCVAAAVSARSRDVADGMWAAMGWTANSLARLQRRHMDYLLRQVGAAMAGVTILKGTVPSAGDHGRGGDTTALLVGCCRVLPALLQAAMTALQQPRAGIAAVQLAAGARLLADRTASMAFYCCRWLTEQQQQQQQQQGSVGQAGASGTPAAAAGSTAGSRGQHSSINGAWSSPGSPTWTDFVTGQLQEVLALARQMAAITPGRVQQGPNTGTSRSEDLQQQQQQQQQQQGNEGPAAGPSPTSNGSSSSSSSANDDSSASAAAVGDATACLANMARRVEACCHRRMVLLGCGNPYCPNAGAYMLMYAKPGDRITCGGCMQVRYCTRACQLNDWSEHRNICRRLRQAGSVPSS